VGIRWKCLVCTEYDLCDRCYASGAHEHQMLKIEHPSDYESVEAMPMEDEPDSVLVGLRVYTKSDAPVKIAGQLRQGKLMRWKKKD